MAAAESDDGHGANHVPQLDQAQERNLDPPPSSFFAETEKGNEQKAASSLPKSSLVSLGRLLVKAHSTFAHPVVCAGREGKLSLFPSSASLLHSIRCSGKAGKSEHGRKSRGGAARAGESERRRESAPPHDAMRIWNGSRTDDDDDVRRRGEGEGEGANGRGCLQDPVFPPPTAAANNRWLSALLSLQPNQIR